MIGYVGNDVEKKICLFEEYAFYVKSLDGRKASVDKKEAAEAMERLIFQIIKLTIDEYEKNYHLIDKETPTNIDEELEKLRKLITLIRNRIKYIEKYLEIYRKATGLSIERNLVLGEEFLNDYQKRADTIDAYNDNLLRIKNLKVKNSDIDGQIEELEKRLSDNDRTNLKNEVKLNEVILTLFSKYKVFDYNPKEVMANFARSKELLELKRGNYELARESRIQKDIKGCQLELTKAEEEYAEYYVKRSILDLVEIEQTTADTYSEYVNKRESIKEVLGRISNHPIYDELNPMIEFQLNNLHAQKVDIERYDALLKEKDRNIKEMEELKAQNDNDDIRNIKNSYIISKDTIKSSLDDISLLKEKDIKVPTLEEFMATFNKKVEPIEETPEEMEPVETVELQKTDDFDEFMKGFNKIVEQKDEAPKRVETEEKPKLQEPSNFDEFMKGFNLSKEIDNRREDIDDTDVVDTTGDVEEEQVEIPEEAPLIEADETDINLDEILPADEIIIPGSETPEETNVLEPVEPIIEESNPTINIGNGTLYQEEDSIIPFEAPESETPESAPEPVVAEDNILNLWEKPVDDLGTEPITPQVETLKPIEQDVLGVEREKQPETSSDALVLPDTEPQIEVPIEPVVSQEEVSEIAKQDIIEHIVQQKAIEGAPVLPINEQPVEEQTTLQQNIEEPVVTPNVDEPVKVSEEQEVIVQVDPQCKIISKDVSSPELLQMIAKNRDKFKDWFYKVSLKLNPMSNMPNNSNTGGGAI